MGPATRGSLHSTAPSRMPVPSASGLRAPSGAASRRGTKTGNRNHVLHESNFAGSRELADYNEPGSNIKVVVRCRGRNRNEIEAHSREVVDCTRSITDVSVHTGGRDDRSTKTYSVDRVFGPDADQSMIFDEVVEPIVQDMLSGINCTVFAYGQTGTGKT